MATLEWRTSPLVPMHVEILSNDAAGEFSLFWGDGASEHNIQRGDSREKKFDKPGRYMAYAVYDGETEAFARTHFQVNTKPEPNVTVEQSTDDPKTVTVTFTTEENTWPVNAGPYIITWDGTNSDLVGGIPGRSVQHRYSKPGQYPLTVEELYSGFLKTFDITVEPRKPDPQFSVTVDDFEVTLTVDAVPSVKPGDKLRIDWHDRSPFQEIDAAVGTKVKHTYAKAGEYAIIARYVGRSHGQFVLVIVPPEE